MICNSFFCDLLQLFPFEIRQIGRIETLERKKMKRKRQKAVVGLMLLTAALTMMSCQVSWRKQSIFGSHSVTENRHLKDFEEIQISGSPTVYYEQADSFSVRVTGQKDQVENIITERDGKTLHIFNKGKFWLFNVQFASDDGLAVYVTSPDLTSIRLNGSGDFISRQHIDTDNMDILLRGSGDVQVNDLICDRCHVDLVGSGDLEVSRLEARKVSASLVGSGDLDLGLLKVYDTTLSLRGSGDIDADFREGCGSVDCELRGSGDITLKGTVRRFSQHTSGSGGVDIDKLSIQQ